MPQYNTAAVITAPKVEIQMNDAMSISCDPWGVGSYSVPSNRLFESIGVLEYNPPSNHLQTPRYILDIRPLLTVHNCSQGVFF